ncbi:unnamed protein product [Owenia fusiformis]|uniref:Uncharacterized protein n=1 Tax=Owenia fusiformis TaxID=6347 RepID=A0A8J1XJ48_OWEFU|nr:unnamed protein product [Owenia fusiformis]
MTSYIRSTPISERVYDKDLMDFRQRSGHVDSDSGIGNGYTSARYNSISNRPKTRFDDEHDASVSHVRSSFSGSHGFKEDFKYEPRRPKSPGVALYTRDLDDDHVRSTSSYRSSIKSPVRFIDNDLNDLTSRSISPIGVPQRGSFGISPGTSHKSLRDNDRSLREVRESESLSRSLQESECRRDMLLQKLRDAHEVIVDQNKKYEQFCGSVKKSNFESDDYRHRENDYKRKIAQLERERNDQNNWRTDFFKQRDEMQERVDGLDLELRTLRSEHSLLQAEQGKRQAVVEQTRAAINLLEEENGKLSMTKESMGKEIVALKESLAIARDRVGTTETELRDNKTELYQLKETYLSLKARNDNDENKLSLLEAANNNMKMEIKKANAELSDLSEERHQLLRQNGVLLDKQAALRAQMDTMGEDKARIVREKMDLHAALQETQHEYDIMHKNMMSLEDRLQASLSDEAQTKHQLDKALEHNKKLQNGFDSVQKVSETLSQELSSAQNKFVASEERLNILQQMSTEKQNRQQLQIDTLEKDITTLKEVKERLTQDFSSAQSKLVVSEEKLNELQRMSMEKQNLHQLQIDTSEKEIALLKEKLKAANDELKTNADILQEELMNWRSKCENLTFTLTRKEVQLDNITKTLQETEELNNNARINQQMFQQQCEELEGTARELELMQSKNERLMQENAENAQMIHCLEMQKNILAKNNEMTTNRTHDLEQLQAAVDQLEAEKSLLEDKLRELERVKDSLIAEKEEMLAKSDMFYEPRESVTMIESKCLELERQNVQLRDVNERVTEKLTQLEQENITLYRDASKIKDMISREEFTELKAQNHNLKEDVQRLKEALNEANTQPQRFNVDVNKTAGDTENTENPMVISLQKEKTSLQSQVTLLGGQNLLLDNAKKRAEEHVKKLEFEIKEFRDNNDNGCGSSKPNVQMECSHIDLKESEAKNHKLEKDLSGVKQDLAQAHDIHEKQELLIQTLKEELEEYKERDTRTDTVAFSNSRDGLDEVKQELQRLQTTLEYKDSQLETKNSEIEILMEENEKTKSLTDELNVRLLAITKHEDPVELEHKLESMTNELHIVSDRLKATQEDKEKSQEKLDETVHEKESLTRKYVQIERQNMSFQEHIEELKEERDMLVRNANILKEGMEEMQILHERELSEMEDSMDRDKEVVPGIDDMRQRITEYETEIRLLKQESSRNIALQEENDRLIVQIASIPSYKKQLRATLSDDDVDEDKSFSWDSEDNDYFLPDDSSVSDNKDSDSKGGEKEKTGKVASDLRIYDTTKCLTGTQEDSFEGVTKGATEEYMRSSSRESTLKSQRGINSDNLVKSVRFDEQDIINAEKSEKLKEARKAKKKNSGAKTGSHKSISASLKVQAELKDRIGKALSDIKPNDIKVKPDSSLNSTHDNVEKSISPTPKRKSSIPTLTRLRSPDKEMTVTGTEDQPASFKKERRHSVTINDTKESKGNEKRRGSLSPRRSSFHEKTKIPSPVLSRRASAPGDAALSRMNQSKTNIT